ncbi:MAG: hypothetical protein OEZ22_03920 [Spirochaetia bacterium]|nr:hypothetical protein [Spirochaetia bacterium]
MKKTRKIAIIILIFIYSHLIFTGCADEKLNEEAELVSDTGVSFFIESSESYSKEQLNFSIDAVIYAAEETAPEDFPAGSIQEAINNNKDNLSIYIVEEKTGPNASCANSANPEKSCKGFYCGVGETKWCEGLYDPNSFSIKISHKKCIGQSALAHELIHLFSHIVNNDGDGSHKNKKYFGGKSSIENTAKKMMIDTYCEEELDTKDKEDKEKKEKKGDEKENEKNHNNKNKLK